MELHYKVYQKVKIYLDKIQCALPNLEWIELRTIYKECEMMVTARVTELRLIQTELLDFFDTFKNSIPYVPSSRCKAIISWYGCSRLQSLRNLSEFQEDLIEADKEITEEAGYIISDDYTPTVLKNLMIKHIDRLKRYQEPESILKGH